MNKTAIKNFAIWARVKLMSDIKTRLGFVGITENGVAKPLSSSTKEIQYFESTCTEPLSITGSDIGSRERIAEQLELEAKQGNYKTAFETLVENTASAWFNRLIAIRFMEVNGYISDGIRMLSSTEKGKQDPDIVTTPFDSDLDFTEAERQEIIQAKLNNETDKVFRTLFFKRCHQLHKALPGLFEDKGDATEFLMRLSVIDTDGVIYHLVHDIDEDDFNVSEGGQVEIIGWLYQYYNTELKDDTFAKLKKNIKITKERIPAATQLFTPDWIVRYMVENSVGRIWIEHLRAVKPETDEKKTAEKFGWKYYLPEAEQEPEVAQQLVSIRKTYENIKPIDIKCIDPCMGSGHILVAMFDVLMDIYLSEGYDEREAAFEIVENNLHGLDIDVRAYQLAYFAVMMKGLQYNRRFLSGRKGDEGERVMVAPHVYAIEESNLISKSYLKYYGTGMDELSRNSAVSQMTGLLDAMKDAKEYGSILNIENYDWELLRSFVSDSDFEGQMTLDFVDAVQSEKLLRKIINVGELLATKYDAVVTNPPYMGSTGMSGLLLNYVKKQFPRSSADLCTVFMEKALDMNRDNGYTSMINTPAWMTMSSFEKMRIELINNNDFVNMAHFGRGVFGADFGTTAFVIKKNHVKNYMATYLRLFERFGLVDSIEIKQEWFLEGKGIHHAKSESFLHVPGNPIAYWVGEATLGVFDLEESISNYGKALQGTITGDNERFLRVWFEVAEQKSGLWGKRENLKWYAHSKGGSYRKWFGNREYVINWENDGSEIKNFKDDKGKLRSRPQNIDSFFLNGITWSDLTAGRFSARYVPAGSTFDASGPTIPFRINDYIYYILGYFNSPVFQHLLDITCPGIHYNNGIITKLPINVIEEKKTIVDMLVQENVDFSKEDWDSFEISWDFKVHPLVRLSRDLWDATAIGASMQYYYGGHPKFSCPLELCFMLWQGECNDRFKKLKENEEELNRIFIDIYGLQGELTPEVEDKDVTVRKADLGRDIRSLLSYAIGCMFGRYSLSEEGLIFAGGEWNDSRYGKYQPDADNIIPILDTAYFDDDIVKRVEEFLSVVFGEDSLEVNLTYIAKALDAKSVDARQTIREYFLNDFFKDHCSTYSVTGSGKRPIYWLFDSGKQNGFKALVYMHHWNADIEARIRALYLHKVQEKYENEVKAIDTMIEHMTDSRMIAKEEKRKEKLKKQIAEVKDYDEILDHIANEHIDIDLDDGVKVNYEKVQTDHNGKKYKILAPIK